MKRVNKDGSSPSSILYLTKDFGGHEQRWLQVLQEHFPSADHLVFSEISPQKLESYDLLLVGPIDDACKHQKAISKTSYVLVSYAFDVLQDAKTLGVKENDLQCLYDQSQGIFFDCQSVAENFHGRFGKSKPYCIAAWGLSKSSEPVSEEFKKQVKELKKKSAGKRILLSARNFTPVHGVHSVLEGLSLLGETRSDFYLLVAGAGELEKELKTTLSEQNHQFLGRLQEAELIYLLNEIVDLYISGAYTDGVSITLLQAMQANCQLALSAVGGNLDLEGKSQLAYFSPGDPMEIKRAVNQLLNETLPSSGLWADQCKEIGDWERNQQVLVTFLKSI